MKKNSYPHAYHQRGMTLIELSVGIVVLLFFAGMILGGFDAIRDRIRAYREVSNVPSVVECIRNRKTTVTNFNNTTATSVLSCFPSSMQNAGGAINFWNGPITLTPTTTVTANDSLAVTSSNYSKTGCTSVAAGLANTFISITANGTTVLPIGGTLDDGSLESACTDDSNNTLVFTMTR